MFYAVCTKTALLFVLYYPSLTALPALIVQYLFARVARRSEGPQVRADFQTGVHTGVTDEVGVVCFVT